MIGLGMMVDEEVKAMAEQVQEDGRPLLGGNLTAKRPWWNHCTTALT